MLTIIVALVLIAIVWKLLMGAAKFGVIILILVAAAYLLSRGGFG